MVLRRGWKRRGRGFRRRRKRRRVRRPVIFVNLNSPSAGNYDVDGLTLYVVLQHARTRSPLLRIELQPSLYHKPLPFPPSHRVYSAFRPPLEWLPSPLFECSTPTPASSYPIQNEPHPVVEARSIDEGVRRNAPNSYQRLPTKLSISIPFRDRVFVSFLQTHFLFHAPPRNLLSSLCKSF